MQSQALLITAPNEISLQAVEIPDPGVGEVLIETWCSCVSPGTELRVLSGKQAGAPPFPLIPGYSASGVIIASGGETSLPVGTKVFYSGTARASVPCCWGGHSGHAVARETSVWPLPEGLAPSAACSAKLAAIARHGQKMVPTQSGENVAVFGLGPIGMYSALLFREAGARVVGIDPSPERRHLAAALGLEVLDVEQPCDRQMDVVVDATGVPAVLSKAIRTVRELPWGLPANPPGRLLLQGSYAGDFSLPYADLFDREVQIIVPRDNLAADVAEVLQFFAEGKLQGVTADFGPPENAHAAYESLKRPGQLPLTGYFRWRG